METLGHSQIKLTMDTYSHVIPQLQRRPRGASTTSSPGAGREPKRTRSFGNAPAPRDPAFPSGTAAPTAGWLTRWDLSLSQYLTMSGPACGGSELNDA